MPAREDIFTDRAMKGHKVVQKDMMSGVLMARLIEDCEKIALLHNTSNTFAATARRSSKCRAGPRTSVWSSRTT